jgi:VWFA-related protein
MSKDSGPTADRGGRIMAYTGGVSRLVLSLALAAVATLPQAPQKPVERGERLWIDAVFVDGKGNPVTDIRKDEIEAWVGHFLIPIDEFISVTPENDAGRGGRLMVLILDDVAVPYADVPRVKETARHFVERMAPGDRMAIVTLNGSGMESTDDRARLTRAIEAYNARATGIVRADVLGRHVLETLSTLSRQLAGAGDRRKTIVGIGRSDLFDRPIPRPSAGQDLLPEWLETMRVMALANTSLYVIDSGTLGSRRLPDRGDEGLAHATGGRAFVGINDLNGAADKIVREASNYYLIGVKAPPVGRDADLRELEVKVRRAGVTVRAREAVSGGR